jgi:hypothetical protein
MLERALTSFAGIVAVRGDCKGSDAAVSGAMWRSVVDVCHDLTGVHEQNTLDPGLRITWVLATGEGVMC